MQLTFRGVAIACAIICFALAAAWLFVPQRLLSLGGIDYTYAAGLIGRRSAALFFGIAIMFTLARNADSSAARTAMAYGFASACGCLATLGLYEYFSGHIGAAIFFAIVVEVVLAILLLLVARNP